jgi:hypothetical protein
LVSALLPANRFQPGYPLKLRDVAAGKDQPMFQCDCGDEQIHRADALAGRLEFGANPGGEEPPFSRQPLRLPARRSVSSVHE